TPPPVAPPAPRVIVKPRVEILPGAGTERSIDWEQWVGQRGLLIVGVLALLATGGFFLNYAIQHGWIPPLLRASGAVLAGGALAGAYLAPIFLRGPAPEPEKFLAYMAVIGAIWLVLSQRVHWRATFNSALFGFFLIPAALIANDLNSAAGVNYAVLGTSLALLATRPKSV